MTSRFVDPWNWCDLWCERCPLAPARCALAQREAQRRWTHVANGDDPDDPDIQSADLDAGIAEAVVAVDRAAREAGIDPTEPPPPEPVVSMAVARMQKLGTVFAVAAVHAIRALPPELRESEAARELKIQALVVARKCARLVDSFDELGYPRTGGEAWATDAVPNLLLLDVVDRRVMATMSALLPPGPERVSLLGVYEELRRVLAPLRAAVPEDARAELAAMIERGDAPSPFAIGRT